MRQPLFIGNDRQIENARVEPKFGARLVEQQGRLVDRLKSGSERLLRENIMDGVQRQLPADQPAHQAIYEEDRGAIDHAAAFWIGDAVSNPDRAFMCVLADPNGEVVDDEMIELATGANGFPQRAATHKKPAHGAEGAGLYRPVAQHPEFIARDTRHRPYQIGELLLRQPRAMLCDYLRRDPR